MQYSWPLVTCVYWSNKWLLCNKNTLEKKYYKLTSTRWDICYLNPWMTTVLNRAIMKLGPNVCTSLYIRLRLKLGQTGTKAMFQRNLKELLCEQARNQSDMLSDWLVNNFNYPGKGSILKFLLVHSWMWVSINATLTADINSWLQVSTISVIKMLTMEFTVAGTYLKYVAMVTVKRQQRLFSVDLWERFYTSVFNNISHILLWFSIEWYKGVFHMLNSAQVPPPPTPW